jgi:hypothetical protein
MKQYTVLPNSRFFTWIHKFSHFFTKSFFLPVWTANKAKIASHGLFHKKYLIFPLREGNMDFFEYERFVAKKPMRGYFKLCLPSIPVKKNDFVKICEFTWIWQHCIFFLFEITKLRDKLHRIFLIKKNLFLKLCPFNKDIVDLRRSSSLINS